MRVRLFFTGFLFFYLIGCATQKANKGGTDTFSTTTGTANANGGAKTSSNRLVPRGLDYSTPVEKFAFGSCADQTQPQPIWKSVIAAEPDLFVMMGDNVYASKPEQKPIGAQYNLLDKVPEFREARQKIPFLAIWDDNDYGQSDGGRDNPEKEIARKEFLSYWSYVRDSIGINQGPLYHSKILGGTTVNQKGRRRKVSKTVPSIQFILLDTRWNRDPWLKNPDTTDPTKRYIPQTDEKVTLLGATQWEWLEDELQKPADLKILVSSIQVIADQHGFEKWGLFPHEREKLYNLIVKTHPKNLVILSGDRHFSAIAKTEIKGWGTLYDITASSLNKPSDLNEVDPSYVGSTYTKENFGLAQVDWSRRLLNIEIKDIDGKTVNSVEIKLKK